jgi:arginyl-tRNA--protein-N-Asp/Glu arginylyltransferase
MEKSNEYNSEGYLNWDQITLSDLSAENIEEKYNQGYVFTRLGRGIMIQTRSVRISLSKFALTSENRRIIKKTEDIKSAVLPLPFKDYNYKTGKLAKDFYETKFGPGIMSAQKIKEMLTSPEKGNFNSLLVYSKETEAVGYVICYCSAKIMHYSYLFYDLLKSPKDMGLGMMIRAIQFAKESGLKYDYLGSIQNKQGLYK